MSKYANDISISDMINIKIDWLINRQLGNEIYRAINKFDEMFF